MKEGNRKEMIESKRGRKEDRVRERKLEKDLEKKEKKSAEERGEDLQDTVARRPGELPPSLRKPLQKLIHHFLIWGDSRASVCAFQGPKVPHFAPKASQSLA